MKLTKKELDTLITTGFHRLKGMSQYIINACDGQELELCRRLHSEQYELIVRMNEYQKELESRMKEGEK